MQSHLTAYPTRVRVWKNGRDVDGFKAFRAPAPCIYASHPYYSASISSDFSQWDLDRSDFFVRRGTKAALVMISGGSLPFSISDRIR